MGVWVDLKRNSNGPGHAARHLFSGGRTAHTHGKAHRFNPEEASKAGKKGGASIATDRTYMATIGQRGGKTKNGYRERQAARRQAESETTQIA